MMSSDKIDPWLTEWCTVVAVLCRSAFFFYCADARHLVREDQPGMSVAEVAKELGKRWETLPDRPKFEALASKDKERYEKVRHFLICDFILCSFPHGVHFSVGGIGIFRFLGIFSEGTFFCSVMNLFTVLSRCILKCDFQSEFVKISSASVGFSPLPSRNHVSFKGISGVLECSLA